MVDLGQKRWKKFHLFYWNKIRFFWINTKICGAKKTSINIDLSIKEEFYICDSSEWCSRCFYFDIERFCGSIGTPVSNKLSFYSLCPVFLQSKISHKGAEM